MAKISFSVMCLALGLIGLLLWLKDAVTQDLPPEFLAMDVVWACSLIGVAFFWRYPRVTVVSNWTLMLSFAVLAWRFQPSHTLAALIYNNAIQAVNVIFAHVGLHFRRKGSGLIRPALGPVDDCGVVRSTSI